MEVTENNTKKQVKTSQSEEDIFSFEEFTQGDIKQIQIKVSGAEKNLFKYVEYKIQVESPFFRKFTCYKRFNEFHAMYKVLKIKYTNMILPDFPSRYQLFKKVETRIQAFDQIMNKLLEYASIDSKIQHNLLSLIYVFLTKNLSGKKNNKKKSNAGQENDHNNSGSQKDLKYISQSLKSSGLDIMYNEDQKQLRSMLDSEYQEEEEIEQMQQDGVKVETVNNLQQRAQRNQNSANTQEEVTLSKLTANSINNENLVRKRATGSTPNQEAILQQQQNNNEYLQLEDLNLHMEFLKEKTEEEEQQLLKQVQDQDLNEEAFKELEKFQGNISICFGYEDQWEEYFARLEGSNLKLFLNLFENHACLIISLYKIKIKFHKKFKFILELRHKKDCKWMLLSIYKAKDLKEALKSYRKASLVPTPYKLRQWKYQLEIASLKKDSTIVTDDRPERFLGKVFLKLHEVQGLHKLPNSSTVFIKIKSYPYIYKAREQICLDTLKWRQQFVFPFIDLFECINIEVYSSINQGWIKEDFQEKLLGSIKIPVQDFISRNNDYIIERKKIKLNMSDWRKKQLQKLGDNSDMYLTFSLRNLCAPSSLYSASPANYNEGQILDIQELSEFIKIMKITFYRFTRMLGNILYMQEWKYYIYYFRYKRFSYIFMFTLCLLTLTLDLNNILSHLLFLLIFVLFLYSPFIRNSPKAMHIINDWIFEQNPEYKEPQIFTLDVQDYLKWKQGMTKVEKLIQDNKDIKGEKDKEKIKDKDNEEEEQKMGLLKSYEHLKKQLFKINYYLLQAANLYEKIKNIIIWQDYKRTFYTFTIALTVLIVLFNFPLRYAILLNLIKKILTGEKRYKKRLITNRKTAEYVIQYLIKTHYPQKNGIVYEKVLEEPWPPTIRQKIQEELKYHLGIYLDNNLMNDYNKPIKMINAIMTCTHKLRLRNKALGHYQKYKNDKDYKELRKKCHWNEDIDVIIQKLIWNFILNVPSDYFRVIHPRII